MCRRVVDVEMSFFETLSMVALWVAETEQSLLQERILLVPERKGDMLVAMGIADTSDTVFAPSEGS